VNRRVLNWLHMEKSSPPDDVAPDLDQRRALIRRILSSHSFEGSPRLRELLTYLAERSEAETLIREQEIGVAVFGRTEGFDTNHDTLVRVQVSQLRKKLQQYFEEEGSGEQWNVQIPKGNYALNYVLLNPDPALAAAGRPAPELGSTVDRSFHPFVPPRVASPDRRKPAFSTGLVLGAALTLAVVVLMRFAFPPRGSSIPAAVAQHLLWSGFRGGSVTLAMSTPLFFFSDTGYERSFRLNYAEDLPEAPGRLVHQPAFPVWDRWVPFDDARAAVFLQNQLKAMGSNVSLRSARNVSVAELRGRRTIVLGHPRGAPFLADAMRGLNFQPPPRPNPMSQAGFVNVAPQAGEMASYASAERTHMDLGNESTPDYALLTSLRISPDGELLSVFGNRVESSMFVVQALFDPGFLRQLNETVFKQPGIRHSSCQVVLRVDYSKGSPTGLIYTAHRVRP
jgi:hypothetical protein